MLCIARTLLSQDVPLSVRPAVTRRYSIETAKHVIKRFSPSGSHSILVFFHTKLYDEFSDGDPLTGAPTVREYEKTELVMGHFFKIQPNQTKNLWTQPNPQKSPPDPTQPIIDTWYGILGYTENCIQQLLHVTDKFCKPTVNESYYSAAVLIKRQ